jgi:hypothetical protein
MYSYIRIDKFNFIWENPINICIYKCVYECIYVNLRAEKYKYTYMYTYVYTHVSYHVITIKKILIMIIYSI